MTVQRRELPKSGDRFDGITFAPFDAARVADYARVSGDDNPLHADALVAASAGFGAPLVHGMLVLSAFEPALAAWRPDLRVVRFSAKFLQPLLHGEAIRVSGRVVRSAGGEDQACVIRLTAQGPQRAPSVIAEAALAFRDIPDREALS